MSLGVVGRKNVSAQLSATERLVQAAQDLSMSRDLPAVMAVVRRAARDLTGADGATFVLREGDLCFYAEENAIGPLWKGRRFPVTACISGWAMLHKQVVVIEDICADEAELRRSPGRRAPCRGAPRAQLPAPAVFPRCPSSRKRDRDGPA